MHIQHRSLCVYVTEATGFSISNRQPIVGLLPQPCSSGNRQASSSSGVFLLDFNWQFECLNFKSSNFLEKKKIDVRDMEKLMTVSNSALAIQIFLLNLLL